MEIRKAMPVHHTATTDEAWDAAAMLKRMGDSPTVAQLKAMHAWMDPEGDADAKSSYKMPHHMVDGEGNVGAANMKACSAAIGALNGARGEAKIPDEDRPAVHRHIAAHMMDGDLEPPELKSDSETIECRTFPLVELRVTDGTDDEPPKIEGHAAVFNQLSEEMFGFRERIAPGAFKRTIKNADIRALFNHDANYVLGRNKAKTLKLAEDERGLAVEIQPPDSQWARDLTVSMKRGDINQMSFSFKPIKEEWAGQDTKVPTRTLEEVKLFDVSVVTFPAYPQTDVAVRSLLIASGIDIDELGRLLAQHRQGLTLDPADADVVREYIETLRSLLPVKDPSDPGQAAHSEGESHEDGDPGQAAHSRSLRRRKLELLSRT